MSTVFAPLEGVRVVDATSSLAGPYCTEILGALGADVVKVEHPARGDEARAWGPPFFEGSSVMFYAANLNKRSLALDVKRGRDVLLRLVDSADVFLQSLRPGTAARLGFGPEELRARKPELVYCVTGEPDRPGVRVGTSIVDQGTGLWAALGILAALLAGGGHTVDVSLFETVVGLLPYQVGSYLAGGGVPGRHGTAFPLIAPYQVFGTLDGDLMIAAGNDGLFARLCAALGLDRLASDPRFATNPARVERRSELAKMIGERIAGERTADLLERLEEAGVPAAPVNDVGQVADHEQTAALGLLQRLPQPTVALPLSLDGERIMHRSPPPRLGANTAEILEELGYPPDEIARLEAEHIVRCVESAA
jgi:crotonobetainyl-CoA:carnitine CoA-transferase CaiB-like acyl-CoA transferase